MYARCESNPAQFSPTQGNRRRFRQFSPNKFRYSPDENQSKIETKVTNESNSCNSNPNNSPAFASFNSAQFNNNNNMTINQQQTYFQPIIYPANNFYPCVSALNYANYQPIPYQYFYNNNNQVNPTFSNNFIQFYIPQPFCQKKPEIMKNEIPIDEDSFGSVFYPPSLIHPTQFKKNKYIEISNSVQQEKSEIIEKPKIEEVEEKNKQTSESEKDDFAAPNENKDNSNIQPIEKVINEIVDSQKIFKPKTFKEIEEEEKKLNIRQYYQPKQISRKIK